MEVNLSVELLNWSESAETIAAMAARLCYSASDIGEILKKSSSDQKKFIEKLVDMGHLSPIEHISFTFGVQGVSRALLAQVTRHRIASFSVQSQRYISQARDQGTFSYIVPPSIKALGKDAEEKYAEQMDTIQLWYNEWSSQLGNDGEKTNEDARFVLPNACETRFIMTMNARELLHFFSLRCCNRAQWEIREMAWKMLALVMKAAPNIFSSAGPGCVADKCPEGKMTCGMAAEVRQRQQKLTDLIGG